MLWFGIGGKCVCANNFICTNRINIFIGRYGVNKRVLLTTKAVDLNYLLIATLDLLAPAAN